MSGRLVIEFIDLTFANFDKLVLLLTLLPLTYPTAPILLLFELPFIRFSSNYYLNKIKLFAEVGLKYTAEVAAIYPLLLSLTN